jgi:hypothetical protein
MWLDRQIEQKKKRITFSQYALSEAFLIATTFGSRAATCSAENHGGPQPLSEQKKQVRVDPKRLRPGPESRQSRLLRLRRRRRRRRHVQIHCESLSDIGYKAGRPREWRNRLQVLIQNFVEGVAGVPVPGRQI